MLDVLLAPTTTGDYPNEILKQSRRWQMANNLGYQAYRETNGPNKIFTQHFIDFLHTAKFKKEARKFLPTSDYNLDAAIVDLIGKETREIGV